MLERGTERKRDLASIDSLPEWSQEPGLGQSKARSSGFSLWAASAQELGPAWPLGVRRQLD